MNIERIVKIWLYIGLFMLFMQVVIGGITRLTGSGLSITKWEIVIGTLPPLNEHAWNEAFNLYKETPQYEKINRGMDLQEFKFIYFWEYIHRLWARLMGFVFLFPFLWFVYKKKIPSWLKKDLGIVVLLAALAASFGWIMVASGLQERPWVNAYKLSIHLLIGFSVFCYLLWTIFKVEDIPGIQNVSKGIKTGTLILSVLIVIQIIFGGWVSGMRAALIYPSWPDMNGEFFPQVIFNISNWNVDNLIEYDKNLFAPALIQFIHRMTAYIIIVYSAILMWRMFTTFEESRIFRKSLLLFIIVLITQVLLGILTLMNSVGTIPVFYGVLHQAVGLILLASVLLINFQLMRRS